MDSLALENDTLRLEFDRKNGALIRLTSTETGWPILDRPNLGLSFRLLVPIEDASPVLQAQKEQSGTWGEAEADLAEFTRRWKVRCSCVGRR